MFSEYNWLSCCRWLAICSMHASSAKLNGLCPVWNWKACKTFNCLIEWSIKSSRKKVLKFTFFAHSDSMAFEHSLAHIAQTRCCSNIKRQVFSQMGRLTCNHRTFGLHRIANLWLTPTTITTASTRTLFMWHLCCMRTIRKKNHYHIEFIFAILFWGARVRAQSTH